LNYAVLKNSYQALALEEPSVNANPKAPVERNALSIMPMMQVSSLLTPASRQEIGLISNCGKNLYLLKGGDYQFTHCTVASYSNNYLPHRDPVLLVSNYIESKQPPGAERFNRYFSAIVFFGVKMDWWTTKWWSPKAAALFLM
jgi:hypothetical protein